jgi:regulation of enolase protein 1 (concanavalin A-like superfamily)
VEARVEWINEPAHWSAADGVLTVMADAGTDFWRTTHYGFVRDSGHVYGEWVDGDFDLTMQVRGAYAGQYDQAGAMVRVDEQHWLKTGIEYVDGRIRFSTVTTLVYSSWTVADLPGGSADLALRLVRQRDAVEIRYGLRGDADELAGVVYLPPNRSAFAGAMCAAPAGNGFEVSFSDVAIIPIG